MPAGWRRLLKTYLQETTVHGLRYLADSDTVLGKAFWTITVASFFGICCLLISRTVVEASSNPIATYANVAPVQEVPFPAVTVWSGLPTRPLGLPGHLLDRHCFDLAWEELKTFETGVPSRCTKEDTEKFRSDFAGLVRQVAYKAYVVLEAFFLRMDERDLPVALRDYFREWSSSLSRFLSQGEAARVRMESMLKEDEMRDIYFHLQEDKFRSLLMNTAEERFDAEFYEEQLRTSAPEITMYNGPSLGSHTISFEGAISYMVRYLSQGYRTQPMSFGGILSSKYDDYMTVLKGKSDGRDMPSTLKSVLAKVSRAALASIMEEDHAELNVFDLPKFVDSRVILRYHKLFLVTGFLGCNASFVSREECPVLRESLSRNLREVLNIMKWTHQPIHSNDTIGGVMDNNQENLTWTIGNEKPSAWNPMFTRCKVPGKEKSQVEVGECSAFTRAPTTKGLGYTFNAAPFWDMFRSTPWSKSFYATMNSAGGMRHVVYPSGAGPRHGLQAFIALDLPNHQGPFTVILHHPLEPGDLEVKGIELSLGMKHTMLVTPAMVHTDANLKDLALQDRSCYFGTEAERAGLTVFKVYSQEGCLFECSLWKAYKECGCVPWDYPHPEENVTMCDRTGDMCFRDLMVTGAQLDICECPGDCDSVSYSMSIISTPLDASSQADMELCRTILRGQGNVRFLEILARSAMNDRIDEVAWSLLTEDDKDDCTLLFKSGAFLQVQLATATAQVVTRSRRVSLTDQLASLGGVLGLFCGVSILSVVESAVWAARILSSAVLSGGNKKGGMKVHRMDG